MADNIDINIAANFRNTLGEGPLWSPDHNALFWIDIIEGKLFRFSPSTQKTKCWEIGAKTAVVAATSDSRLLLACQNFLLLFDPETGTGDRLLDFEMNMPNNRPNDGKVDPAGSFWFGTTDDLEQTVAGTVYRFGRDRKLTPVLEGIGNPNTFVWSPDKRKFYTADSVRQIMWVFEYDVDTGDISNRREFFSLAGTDIIPDGSTVDVQGYLWNAQWNGWRIVRYAPDGSVDRIVEMPVACPTSCIFGGEGLNILYVTSARKGQTEQALKQQSDAGALFALDVGVKGVSPHSFFISR